MNEVYGYKVFNSEWTCRGFQYEVGKTYKQDEDPKICERGFHFCTNICDCFNYYPFNPSNKVARIVALGEIDTEEGDSKYCTNIIKILEEVSWDEVLTLANVGKKNTGKDNTGISNLGHNNVGSNNNGNRNTGCLNFGNRNTGWGNFGDGNTGDCNHGFNNAGHHNYGGYNSGDCNLGYGNSGDWNSGRFLNGCFNTMEESTIYFFNKPSSWTYYMWRASEARSVLAGMPQNKIRWVNDYKMTEQEKIDNPDYKIRGGFLKKIIESSKENRQKWWDELHPYDQYVAISLPNFDPDIFEEITKIKVDVQDVLKRKDEANLSYGEE